MKFTKKGFTLIELLVVIAIIGLLSTLAVVALNSARLRSRDAKRVADIRQIQTALELGFSEVQRYPSDDGADRPLALGSTTSTVLCNVSGVPTFQASTSGCSTIFMGLVPSNPGPNGKLYYYNSTGLGTSVGSDYFLSFELEGQTGQLGLGPNCANPDGIVAGASC